MATFALQLSVAANSWGALARSVGTGSQHAHENCSRRGGWPSHSGLGAQPTRGDLAAVPAWLRRIGPGIRCRATDLQ